MYPRMVWDRLRSAAESNAAAGPPATELHQSTAIAEHAQRGGRGIAAHRVDDDIEPTVHRLSDAGLETVDIGRRGPRRRWRRSATDRAPPLRVAATTLDRAQGDRDLDGHLPDDARGTGDEDLLAGPDRREWRLPGGHRGQTERGDGSVLHAHRQPHGLALLDHGGLGEAAVARPASRHWC